MILLPEKTDKTRGELWLDLIDRTQTATRQDTQLEFEILHLLAKQSGIPVPGFYELSISYSSAAAFIRRELPGWSYRLQYHANYTDGNKHIFTLQAPPENPDGAVTDPLSWSKKYDGKGYTEAWAMLSAFCQAKYERGE